VLDELGAVDPDLMAPMDALLLVKQWHERMAEAAAAKDKAPAD
jgi:hypothetical protein